MNLLEVAKGMADAAGGSRLPPESVRELTAAAGTTVERLMLQLIPLAKARARPMLSGFQVGAVARGASGALYFGANLEFAGGPVSQTVHAEQAAVINAAAHAETGVSALAVSAPPCGYCRQFLQELATADQLEILLANQPPAKLTDYLPGAFGPANLGITGGLLSPQRHPLEWASPGEQTPAAELALRAATASYAPYTKAFAAVALITRAGETFVGPYLENAAFNPSISPAQAAAVALMLAGRGLDDVETAILVQTEGSRIDQTAATRALLNQVAPHVAVQELLVRTGPQKDAPVAKTKARPPKDLSFYFFDFDDNIMFLPTPILIRNTATKRSKKVTTADFAGIRMLLGRPGPWKEFELFENTYSHFRDVPPDKLKPGRQQYFVEDVAKAVSTRGTAWQAPSWPLFKDACAKRRPVAIITARGHSRETLMAGIRVLAERKLIPREPNYLAVYPVGHPQVIDELLESLDDPEERARLRASRDNTSDLKRIAIRNAVETALRVYGTEPEHRFGMSDDDPRNVDLIVKAMCDCKTRHLGKRFFVINTHQNEWVKLEVFPVDYPVTGRAAAGEVIA
jgi:cytidine deaminase